jgi:hypothetical protein
MNTSFAAYCLWCRMKIQTKNPKRAMSKNGKHAYLMGKCPKCGHSVSVRRLVTHEGGLTPKKRINKTKKALNRRSPTKKRKPSPQRHRLGM